MHLPSHIHIFGASGTGTTSLAAATRAHVEFLEWAGRYDTGGLEMRSRALHEAWVAALPGAVLRLEGDRAVDEQLAQIEARVAAGDA
jgi:hypothetical protein